MKAIIAHNIPVTAVSVAVPVAANCAAHRELHCCSTGAPAVVTAVATAGNTAIAAALLEAIALEGTCALATMPSQLVHLYCTHRSCTAKNSDRSVLQ